MHRHSGIFICILSDILIRSVIWVIKAHIFIVAKKKGPYKILKNYYFGKTGGCPTGAAGDCGVDTGVVVKEVVGVANGVAGGASYLIVPKEVIGCGAGSVGDAVTGAAGAGAADTGAEGAGVDTGAEGATETGAGAGAAETVAG